MLMVIEEEKRYFLLSGNFYPLSTLAERLPGVVVQAFGLIAWKIHVDIGDSPSRLLFCLV